MFNFQELLCNVLIGHESCWVKPYLDSGQFDLDLAANDVWNGKESCWCHKLNGQLEAKLVHDTLNNWFNFIRGHSLDIDWFHIEQIFRVIDQVYPLLDRIIKRVNDFFLEIPYCTSIILHFCEYFIPWNVFTNGVHDNWIWFEGDSVIANMHYHMLWFVNIHV